MKQWKIYWNGSPVTVMARSAEHAELVFQQEYKVFPREILAVEVRDGMLH